VSSSGARPAAIALGVLLVLSTGVAALAVVTAVRRESARPMPASAPAPVALIRPPARPIAAEARVFATTPAMLAFAPDVPRGRTAHPRNWETYRFLRAYEGAPPRIPHALSAEEFRTGVCRTCHERGGYSLRFAAYVPVTPHPELGMCLQCHVGDDAVMGTASAAADPNARCPLCHGATGGAPIPAAAATWPTSVWPTLSRPRAGEPPPPIPHDLQLRGNCLACHDGPAAVAGLRTTHPERANCRQCHLVADPEAKTYARPVPDRQADSGVAR